MIVLTLMSLLFLISYRCTRDTIFVIVLLWHLRDRLVLAIAKPSNYQEASSITEWQLAMADELAALAHTGTWDIVPLPSHVVPIT
jgi:hypothetical protein